MASVLNVARYICAYYRQLTGEVIDELKLHKILYLCQREKLAILNEILFSENLEGWVHGPVSPETRRHFSTIIRSATTNMQLDEQDAYIVRSVVCQYGHVPSTELINLTHEEYSWKQSRKDLYPDQIGNRNLKLEDIRIDAEKVRPIDYAWGMYYDEFNDLEVVR